MYRKESNGTVRFFYQREALFNDVSLMSNFMAKNLATKDGASLTDEFSISDDEKDLFGVCVQQALPDIYEAMSKITHGVSSAFDDCSGEDLAKDVSITSGSTFPEGTYDGSDTKDSTYTQAYYRTPGYNDIIYLKSSAETGTAASTKTYYKIVNEDFVVFKLQDNDAYNDNVLSLVDASIYNAIKHGVLKEFYSVVVQPDFFKVCATRFVEELFKLKMRLFQLKKKSVVSSLS